MISKIKVLIAIIILSFVYTKQAYSIYWWHSFQQSKLKACYYSTMDVAYLKQGYSLILQHEIRKNQCHTFIIDLEEKNVEGIITKEQPYDIQHFRLANIAPGKVLYFGGLYEPETWLFEYDSLKWTKLNPPNNPTIVDSISICYLTEKKVLFTGTRSVVTDGIVNHKMETWIFHLENENWERIETDTTPWISYAFHLSDIDDNKALLQEWDDLHLLSWPINNTWIFDYNVKQWIDQNPTNKPESLSWSCLASIFKGNAVLFGGFFHDYKFNDTTYIYNLDSNLWSALYLKPNPGFLDGRFSKIAKGHIVLPTDDRIWILSHDPEKTEYDRVGPHIVTTFPNNGQKNVVQLPEIKIRFSEKVMPESIVDSNFRLKYSGERIKGVLKQVQDSIITFVPEDSLIMGATYFFEIEKDIIDTAFNSMEKSYQFSFTIEDFSNASNEDMLPLISVNPNPIKDLLCINIHNIGKYPIEIEIINLLGKSIYRATSYHKSLKIDTNEFPVGFYLLIIKSHKSIQKFRLLRVN